MKGVDRDSSIDGREFGTDPFGAVEADPVVDSSADSSVGIGVGGENAKGWKRVQWKYRLDSRRQEVLR